METWIARRLPVGVVLLTVVTLAAGGCASSGSPGSGERPSLLPTATLPPATSAGPTVAAPAMSSGDHRSVTVGRTPMRVRFTLGRIDAVRFVIDTQSSNPAAWLVTPSGDVLGAGSKRLIHSSVEGEQVFWVRHPEVGRWSVVLRSSAGPEAVTVSVQPIDIPVDPIAVLHLRNQGGGTFSLTSEGSHDPDGVVTRYEWSFGDNQYGAGSTASHTYPAPGSYAVALIVTDDTGRKGFAFSNASVGP